MTRSTRIDPPGGQRTGHLVDSNDRGIVMNPVRKLEMQCTHAEFLRELPIACGKRPYEIIGERAIIREGEREIQIKIQDEPIRHLGSLDLPMEEITLRFIDYTEAEADKFMVEFRRHTMRGGG